MTFKEKVCKLLEASLDSRPDLFLIECKVSIDNHISILLDGDEGVNLKSCVEISRQIEHNLDREIHDFSLEVASAGVGSPLQKTRQFLKNMGRKLRVEREAMPTLEGMLIDSNEHGFTLQWKQREPKPIGKGKITVTKSKTLSFNEIISAKVLVK
ncbi:MAG: ribosome assembly cofactor RimP [Flavobacteriaceae bacterium]|nr:ribosome assembly cofactor RimP [Flavobacteriaceae bacterium]MDG2062688.1 ribosome assembly cofactor RimP [Flavobacteriaceae bacterium]|tara:strand:+ start:1165 stop:1629 length:465 start_codon:yes stop_codon:yes gene_type:complete